MVRGNKSKSNKNYKDDFANPFLLFVIFISVLIIGILQLLLMQKLANKSRFVCSYIGRLWMPDREKNVPGIYKCYTYEEYYNQ